MSRKVFVFVDGKWMSSREAAKHLNITPSAICYRIKVGTLKTREDKLLTWYNFFENNYNVKFTPQLRKILQKMIFFHKTSNVIEDKFMAYYNMSSRQRMARTLQNFVLVYGEKHGNIRYLKYIQNQKDSYVKKSTDFYRRNSIRCKEYWMYRKGFTEVEAQEKVTELARADSLKANSNREPHTQFRNIQYWLNKGISEDTAKRIMRQLQTNRKNSKEVSDQLRQYYVDVWYHTNQNLHKVENIEMRSKDYHVDHIFSIRHGFDNNIEPEIIGSEVNLRIITAHKNNKKYSKSHITLEELYVRFNSR